jgi:formylmethanofuran dehydrogenase subunit E
MKGKKRDYIKKCGECGKVVTDSAGWIQFNGSVLCIDCYFDEVHKEDDK